MADFYYAQQKGRGHVVEGMRFRFQLRGQIRCLVNVLEAWGREAMVLPPSLVDSSESIDDVDTDIDTDNTDTDTDTDTDNDHEDNVPPALNIVTHDIVFAFLLLSENTATCP